MENKPHTPRALINPFLLFPHGWCSQNEDCNAGTNNPFPWPQAWGGGLDFWRGRGELVCSLSFQPLLPASLAHPCGWDGAEISLAGCKDYQHCSLPYRQNCVFPRKNSPLEGCGRAGWLQARTQWMQGESVEEDSWLRTVQLPGLAADH